MQPTTGHIFNARSRSGVIDRCRQDRGLAPRLCGSKLRSKPMKRPLFILTIALATLGCGGDSSGPPLTQGGYSAQGNAICVQMNAELDALTVRASQSLSPEQDRDLFVEANLISREAIDALFALSPPTLLIDDRLSLLELVSERRNLIERMNDGADVIDEITVVTMKFEEEAQLIWPSCAAQT